MVILLTQKVLPDPWVKQIQIYFLQHVHVLFERPYNWYSVIGLYLPIPCTPMFNWHSLWCDTHSTRRWIQPHRLSVVNRHDMFIRKRLIRSVSNSFQQIKSIAKLTPCHCEACLSRGRKAMSTIVKHGAPHRAVIEFGKMCSKSITKCFP